VLCSDAANRAHIWKAPVVNKLLVCRQRLRRHASAHVCRRQRHASIKLHAAAVFVGWRVGGGGAPPLPRQAPQQPRRLLGVRQRCVILQARSFFHPVRTIVASMVDLLDLCVCVSPRCQ